MPASSFDDVIQGIEQDQNLLRIKKLLIYACYKQWENNPQTLHQTDLPRLVQDVLQLAPTWQQLEMGLNCIVTSLNKAAEYALVANSILSHLKCLYIGFDTPLERSPHSTFHSQYSTIADVLNRDQQQIRIKKLLISACGYAWENDPNRLSLIDTLGLVQALHQLAPSLEALSTVLNHIVQTLNRRDEYQAIAATIIQAFYPLYEAAPVEPAAEPPSETQLLPNTGTGNGITGLNPGSNSSSEPPSPLSFNELFDLRLEIMKYTNPWRTKYLLINVIHAALDESHQDINALVKMHELDSLLCDLFQAFSSYDRLIERLTSTAKMMKDRDEYTQTASAIARAMKPYYASSRQGTHLIQKLDREAERITEIVVKKLDATQINASDDDEHTCQFSLPSMMSLQSSHPATDTAEATGFLAMSEPLPLKDSSISKHEEAYTSLLTSIRSIFGEQP